MPTKLTAVPVDAASSGKLMESLREAANAFLSCPSVDPRIPHDWEIAMAIQKIDAVLHSGCTTYWEDRLIRRRSELLELVPMAVVYARYQVLRTAGVKCPAMLDTLYPSEQIKTLLTHTSVIIESAYNLGGDHGYGFSSR